jgi:hypothetical protein
MKALLTRTILLWTLIALPCSASPSQEDKNIVEIFGRPRQFCKGFQIKIDRSGHASWFLEMNLAAKNPFSEQPIRGQQQLSDSLTKKLFDDVESAMPFSEIPMDTSARYQFVEPTRIRYMGDWTPDLDYETTVPKLTSLREDASEICSILGLRKEHIMQLSLQWDIRRLRMKPWKYATCF